MARQNVCLQSSGMYLNKDIKAYIDLTPCEAQATWSEIRSNITSISDDMEENVETYENFDGDENEVASVQPIFGFEGNSNYSDPAHKMIIDMKHKRGVGRKGNFKVIYPWGTIVEGSGTVTEIKVLGGASKERLTLSFNLSFDESFTTVILPEYSEVTLGDFPTPTKVVANKLVKFTFADVTNEDKAKQPIPELLNEKLGVLIEDIVADYQIKTYTQSNSFIIELVFNSIGASDKIKIVNTGVIARSLQQYAPSVINL